MIVFLLLYKFYPDVQPLENPINLTEAMLISNYNYELIKME